MIISNNKRENTLFELEAFYNRLEQAIKKPLGLELSKLITVHDKNTFLNYILTGAGRKSTADKVFNDLLMLKPGSGLRIDKARSGLSRTLNIIRTHLGQYELIIETKSKLANHTTISPHKQKLPVRSATLKTGKPAWRIDGDEVEYFNLTSHFMLGNDWNFEPTLRKGIELSHKLSTLAGEHADKFIVYHLGATYQGKHGTKVSIYSQKATDDFSNISGEIKKLNNFDKYKIMLQICEAIKVLHDKHICHMDIKSDNILVFRSTDGQFNCKLGDFDLAEEYSRFYTPFDRDLKKLMLVFKDMLTTEEYERITQNPGANPLLSQLLGISETKLTHIDQYIQIIREGISCESVFNAMNQSREYTPGASSISNAQAIRTSQVVSTDQSQMNSTHQEDRKTDINSL